MKLVIEITSFVRGEQNVNLKKERSGWICIYWSLPVWVTAEQVVN